MALRKEILNEMDNQFLSTSELAQKANIDRTTLHKFLYEGTNIGLTALINISLELFPNNHNEIMCKWCLQLEKPENMRFAMEYTSLNGNFDVLMELIKRQQNEGRKNKQWAEVYQLLLDMLLSTTSTEEIIERSRSFKSLDSEMTILSRIIEVYAIYKEQKYSVMFEMAKSLEKQIEAIEGDYIRESFMVRCCEMFASGYLAKNDIKKARYYSNVVFNSKLCASLKGGASYIIGMSFLFEDYDLCVSNLELSDELRRKNKTLEGSSRNIEFAKIHWGVSLDRNSLNFAELAHLEAKAGNKDKSLMYLEKDLAKEKNSPFKKYYKGLALSDVSHLWDSYSDFLSQGNLFFANLPRLELIRLGESEFAVNAYIKLLTA